MIRLFVIPISCVLVLFGCSGHDEENPGLASIMEAMHRAAPVEQDPLFVTVRVLKERSELKLRWRLQNISADAVDFSEAELPNFFTVHIVPISLSGRSLTLKGGVGSLLTTSPPPRVVIDSRGFLEHDVNLKDYVAYDSLPFNEDVVLLWSYSRGKYVSTGILPFRKTEK